MKYYFLQIFSNFLKTIFALHLHAFASLRIITKRWNKAERKDLCVLLNKAKWNADTFTELSHLKTLFAMTKYILQAIKMFLFIHCLWYKLFKKYHCIYYLIQIFCLLTISFLTGKWNSFIFHFFSSVGHLKGFTED